MVAGEMFAEQPIPYPSRCFTQLIFHVLFWRAMRAKSAQFFCASSGPHGERMDQICMSWDHLAIPPRTAAKNVTKADVFVRYKKRGKT
jgi:hypothetical protein